IRDFHVTGVQTCALPIWALRLAALLPAALLPALVVVNTLGGDRRIVVDARAAGLAVAVALVAGSKGRAPFVLVVVAAAAVTALRSEERRVRQPSDIRQTT